MTTEAYSEAGMSELLDSFAEAMGVDVEPDSKTKRGSRAIPDALAEGLLLTSLARFRARNGAHEKADMLFDLLELGVQIRELGLSRIDNRWKAIRAGFFGAITSSIAHPEQALPFDVFDVAGQVRQMLPPKTEQVRRAR